MAEKNLTQVDIEETIDDAIKLFCVSKDQDSRDCVRKLDITSFRNYVVDTLSIPTATEDKDGLMSKDSVKDITKIEQKISNIKNEEHYFSNEYYTFPETINDIAYGNGKYVAVGNSIYTSEDKINWNVIPDTYGALSIAFGNNKYMAVGKVGFIITSEDAINWTELSIPIESGQTLPDLNQIIFDGSKFVIVGSGGKIFTSDGVEITNQNSPTSIDLKSIVFRNGIFLAVGYKSPNSVLLKSVDAVTWELISLSSQLTRNPYDKIVFGNGVFVIKDSRRVYTTTDGTDLAAHSTPEPPIEICFIGDKFLLLSKRHRYQSKNGVEWDDITCELTENLSKIQYIDNEILAITNNKLIDINIYNIDGVRKNVHNLSTNISNMQSDITELNSALLNKQSYPDYSKISTIISGGVGTKTYTCTENGFVQFVGTSGNNSVKPEIDLSINGVYVFKYRTGYQTDYVKATSGLFPVKQGDVIKCVIQSSFVNESVRFYQLRY